MELANEENFDSIWFFATTFLPTQTFNGVDNVVCSFYCDQTDKMLAYTKIPLNLDNNSRACLLMTIKKLVH